VDKRIVFVNRLKIAYRILCQFYLNVISKLHACTFVTCSLNVIKTVRYPKV